MSEVLFLSHRIPYPPDKGDKIRSWHVFAHLAARHRVHLGCFIDDARDWQYVRELKLRTDRSYFAELRPGQARLRSAVGLLGNGPLTLRYYHHAGLRRWVELLVRERRPEVIYVFSAAMAAFVPAQTGRSTRLIVDFVDVDSDKWRQYAADRAGLASWIYRREGQRLLEFERAVTQRCDASLFVSPDEAAFFCGLAPQSAHKVVPVRNGVDAGYFSPERDYPSPYPPGVPVLVFSGAMDYRPNVDAVTWFARGVLPRVRQRWPAVRFAIVGSSPTPEVRALANLDGVMVTGRVADVRPYLAHSRVVVASLRISRGVQNKVLEGMAMAKPVIVTPQGLQGIEATPGEHVLVAPPNVDGFTAAVTRLLGDGASATALGQRARALVQDTYGWRDSLALIDRIMRGERPPTWRAIHGDAARRARLERAAESSNRTQTSMNAQKHSSITALGAGTLTKT